VSNEDFSKTTVRDTNMNAKLWMMTALLLGSAAQAQQTWDFTNSNPNFDGYVTIAQPLAANGTQTVSLTGYGFNNLMLDSTSIGGLQYAAGGAPQITFTTVNNVVTAWGANWYFDEQGTNSPLEISLSLSPNSDSYTRQQVGAACDSGPSSLCQLVSYTSSGGAWVDPPASAPEIDPAAAAAGLTLLLGGLAVLRGRRA
jgi:hypothetical protein